MRFLALLFLAACTVEPSRTAIPEQQKDIAPCYDTGAADSGLRSMGEAPVAMGIMGRGVMQLYRSPSGDTWTLSLALPEGVSCFVAAGRNWQTTKEGSL